MLSGCTSDIAKSIDEQLSEYAGMPCSSQNLAAGGAYCNRPRTEMMQAQMYCYKTLGSTTCYRDKNPYDTEKSERVRPVMELESHGADIMTAEEYELRQIMASQAAVDTQKTDN